MPGTEPKPFCGIATSLAEYDDARALREYVWKHYRHLMTPLERRVTEYTVPLVSGVTDFKCQRLYAFLEDRDGHVADSDVLEAFKQPYDTRKDAAIDRVIAECHDRFHINRCPECDRVVRAPKSAQCLWCGHDWHVR